MVRAPHLRRPTTFAHSGAPVAKQQAILILGQDRHSQIALCLKAAPSFLLNEAAAVAIVVSQMKTIKERWFNICDEAALEQVDRNLFWRRQFLNPYAFIGAPKSVADIVG